MVPAAQAARARGCSLRVLGGGHSFSALAVTDGITLSLDGYQGLVGGSVLDPSPTQDPDLFEAARLGLGTIGVVLEVTLQCVPAYRLRPPTPTSCS